MIRALVPLIAAAALASGATAQIRLGDQKPTLQGEPKIRYICRQLELSPEQERQMESILEAFRAESDEIGKHLTERMEEIRVRYRSLQEAQRAGNKEEIERIKKQLQDLAPAREAENHFWEAFTPTLTEAQKKKLEQAQLSVEGGAGVSFKPANVLRIMRTIQLDDDQQRRLEDLLKDLRAKMSAIRDESDAARQPLLDEFIQSCRGLLKGDQTATFDKRLEFYRSAIPAGPQSGAITQPTAPGASDPHVPARMIPIPAGGTSTTQPAAGTEKPGNP